MRLRGSAVAILAALLFVGPVARAADPSQNLPQALENENSELRLENYTELLNSALVQYQRVCIDKDGNVIQGIVRDSDTGMNINCVDEGLRLQQASKQLSKSLSLQQKASGTPDSCSNEDAGLAVTQMDQLGSLVGTLKTDLIADPNSCKPGRNTEILSTQCLEEAACDGIQSARPLLGVLGTLVPSCPGSRSGSNCLASIFEGVWQNVWSSAKGLWNAAKIGARAAVKGVKWAGKKVRAAWDDFFRIEDKTSDSLLLASQQSDSGLDLFLHHPRKFIENLAKVLFNAIANAVKSDFACDRWAGAPYVSKCVEPMKSWDCASCGERINAVCGVAGYVGGEVLTAILTGGLKSLITAGTKGAAKISVALSEKIVAVLPKTVASRLVSAGKVAKLAGSSVGRITAETWAALSTRVAQIADSPAMKAIQASIQTGAQKLTNYRMVQFGQSFVLSNLEILKDAGQTYKLWMSPITQYWALTGKMTSLGYMKTDATLNAALARARAILDLDSAVPEKLSTGIPPVIVVEPASPPPNSTADHPPQSQ